MMNEIQRLKERLNLAEEAVKRGCNQGDQNLGDSDCKNIPPEPKTPLLKSFVR